MVVCLAYRAIKQNVQWLWVSQVWHKLSLTKLAFAWIADFGNALIYSIFALWFVLFHTWRVFHLFSSAARFLHVCLLKGALWWTMYVQCTVYVQVCLCAQEKTHHCKSAMSVQVTVLPDTTTLLYYYIYTTSTSLTLDRMSGGILSASDNLAWRLGLDVHVLYHQYFKAWYWILQYCT